MTRQILAWAAVCVLMTAFSVDALAGTGTYREGSVSLLGVCYDYRIMTYEVQSGGGVTTQKVKVFMSPCGQNCFGLVYDGPQGSYTGPLEEIGTALPISIGSGGHGYVTVSSGEGGTFAPDGTNAACDASHTSDFSTTLVIDKSYIEAMGLE